MAIGTSETAAVGDRRAESPNDPEREVAPWRRRLRRAVGRRRRLLIACCLILLGAVVVRAFFSGASGASLEDALATVLARDGLRVDTDTVLWLDEDRGPVTTRGALFLAAREGELADLYYADVRAGGERTALDVAFVSNLTRTASSAEEQLVRVGSYAAFLGRVGDRVDALVVLDLEGEPDSLTDELSWRERTQIRVTNLQETGRARGFGVRRYQLSEPIAGGELSVHGDELLVDLGESRLRLDPRRSQPSEGAELVELHRQHKGTPGTIAWVVDTVRNLSFVGPEPIEWLEHRVFGLKDRFDRAWYAAFGSGDTATQAAEDLGLPEPADEEARERIAMLTVTDPELGWPPSPIDPVITEREVEGEGRWLPIAEDPFVNAYPNAPPAFFQTFLRADPEREFTRVYITIWDPRQVQLRIQAGTREPESATGQRGTGMIPRDEETMRRLVGAFNGGFQALHGEFGMMAGGRVYLPPKPWAATVAVFDDGRVGMGSWREPDWRGRYFDERLANRQIPEDMVDMRQNLTSVVEDRRYNPWERWWWGAAPREAEEQTNTTRSGLCLTEEGFLAYFWGQGMGPEALGEAMSAARCARGLHLDMNSAHCGFELFRPIAPDESAPPLAGRPRSGVEHEGDFPRAPRGWRLRARRAVRSMGMPFPRYSGRDGRDFFYLTLRPVLPGPHLEGASEGGPGFFSTAGLPHAGWPHAFARTWLGESEEARTWVVRIDPSRAVPAAVRRPDHARALAYLTGPVGGGDHGVLARRREVGHAFHVGRPEGEDRIIATGRPLAEVDDAEAALGVDSDGFLVYAERAGDPRPLMATLQSLGVTAAVALSPGVRLAFSVEGRHPGPDGLTEREVRPGASAFYAEERPVTEVLYPDNTPTPYRDWGYLQGQRVRYFPDGPPRFARPLGDE